MACAEVGALFAGRSPCSSELEAAAGVAAAYRTAMQVEASYHPESTGEGSLFAALRDMWDRSSAAVAEAINARCPFDDGSDGDGGTLAPTGRTPNRVLIGPSRVRW